MFKRPSGPQSSEELFSPSTLSITDPFIVGCVGDGVDYGIGVVDGVYSGVGVGIDVYVEDMVVPLLKEGVVVNVVVEDGSVDACFEVVVVDISVDDVVVGVGVEDGLDDVGAKVLVSDVSFGDCIVPVSKVLDVFSKDDLDVSSDAKVVVVMVDVTNIGLGVLLVDVIGALDVVVGIGESISSSCNYLLFMNFAAEILLRFITCGAINLVCFTPDAPFAFEFNIFLA
ncbi:hypothetical protein Lser_V15G12061 [Lactuca serriola]